VDVGNVIELYAEFTRSGATYTPFPDPRSHSLPLARLREPAVRQRLRTLWLDPMALDPSRVSAQVTREVASKLALLSRDLEAEGHRSEHVAAFLTRCLFSMFAEDVGLLPKAANGEGAFVHLLRQYREEPDALRHLLRALWTDMDRGGFSLPLAKPVLRFNGKLFKGWGADSYVLPLSRRLISGLLGAAESNWREVEPAIIGTLLERALDPKERHALGAHYTPRAYVERLVLPTVVEPLRADWANAQAAALLLATEANALEGKKRDDKMAVKRASRPGAAGASACRRSSTRWKRWAARGVWRAARRGGRRREPRFKQQASGMPRPTTSAAAEATPCHAVHRPRWRCAPAAWAGLAPDR
jgi:hypothetical protein